MTDAFLLHALLAGFGLALMCGPLSCFVAWKRLAYFGDAIGHASLLGVVLGLLAGVDVTLAIIIMALISAVGLLALLRQGRHAPDTLLGVIAHGGLATGLVLLSLSGLPVDLESYLFGDILAVGQEDILLIYSVAAVVLLWLLANWNGMMLMVVSPDIARVEGVNVPALKFLLMILLALVVAVSIKIVGILLVTSMLILPAATARYFANSPHGMAFYAFILGMAFVTAGIAGSYYADTPTGPSIVVAGIGLFMLANLLSAFRNWMR